MRVQKIMVSCNFSVNSFSIEKTQEINEPQSSHVKHFCGTTYSNSLVHSSPVTVPYQCKLWSVEWGGMQSVECEDSENNGVLSLSAECNV